MDSGSTLRFGRNDASGFLPHKTNSALSAFLPRQRPSQAGGLLSGTLPPQSPFTTGQGAATAPIGFASGSPKASLAISKRSPSLVLKPSETLNVAVPK